MKFWAFACMFAATACSQRHIEVDDPYYLGQVGEQPGLSLIRCTSLPGHDDKVCAGDGLPGPHVIAAGASKTFVVVHQYGTRADAYYYFNRTQEERSGPEAIVGPLSKQEFLAAKAELGLPDFTVRA